MQTWFINGRNMGHAELLRWRASQALKVEAEVVEPNEPKEEIKESEVVQEVEVEKVELQVEKVEEVQEAEEAKELGELETPPIIKPWCTGCDSKGNFHKKGCPLKK